MMLTTKLDFGGSPSPSIGVDWWGQPFRPIKRIPGQLLGLGMTSEEARVILATGTYGGKFTQAQVDEAWKVYYGAGGTYQEHIKIEGGPTTSCGGDPAQATVTLMSSPTCQPTDTVCVALLQMIEEYNNALQRQSVKLWERAWCEKQNCQNRGTPGYPRDCAGLYPDVVIPAQPTYPGAKAILQQAGVVTGYSNQPIGTTSNTPVPVKKADGTPTVVTPPPTKQPGDVPAGSGGGSGNPPDTSKDKTGGGGGGEGLSSSTLLMIALGAGALFMMSRGS